MANFNTYQTRNLYVVKDLLTSGAPDAAGELLMETTATGEVFFKYYNGDAQATRTDLIRPASIISLKKTKAGAMDIKLKMHTLAVDTSAVTLSSLIGKTLNCVITIQQVGSYDASDSITVTASVVGNSTNTANATAFHKALAEAIALALPETKYPLLKVFSNGSEVTKSIAKAGSSVGAAGGVVLVESAQGYRRGLLSKEAYPFSVAFVLHDGNKEDIVWGTDTIAASNIAGNTVIPSVYELADLEEFTMGERGDDKRGYNYPYNYAPTPLIDLSKEYDVVSVEFAWQGNAENIQKSPRMIQFACEVTGSGSGATSDADDIYNALKAAMDGTASGSGSGA